MDLVNNLVTIFSNLTLSSHFVISGIAGLITFFLALKCCGSDNQHIKTAKYALVILSLTFTSKFFFTLLEPFESLRIFGSLIILHASFWTVGTWILIYEVSIYLANRFKPNAIVK